MSQGSRNRYQIAYHDKRVVQILTVCHKVQDNRYKIASHEAKVVKKNERKEEEYVSFY